MAHYAWQGSQLLTKESLGTPAVRTPQMTAWMRNGCVSAAAVTIGGWTVCVTLCVTLAGATVNGPRGTPVGIEQPRPIGHPHKKIAPVLLGAFGRLLVCGGASYFCYSRAWYPALHPASPNPCFL